MTQGSNVSPGAPAPAPQAAGTEKPKGLAVAGMVLGICGVVLSPPCFLIVVGPIAAVIGIVLSVIALGRAKAGTAAGKNMAMAGLICGAAGIVLWVIMMVVGIGKAKEGVIEMQDIMNKMKEEQEKSAPAEPGGGD